MPTSVFSKRFYSEQGATGTTPSIHVPAGHVYVIKQITMYADPTIGQVRAFFQDDVSGAALFAAGWSPGNPEWFGFYGAIVFEPGQSFHFHVSNLPTDGADVYAGGYDLIT